MSVFFKKLADLFVLKKVLLYSTRNYIQYPVINENRKEHEK